MSGFFFAAFVHAGLGKIGFYFAKVSQHDVPFLYYI
jgi:hypothetical protein